MITNLFGWKKDFYQNGIFLSFCGPITQSLLVEIGHTLKQKMLLEDAGKKTIFRVFAMVVENAQNIIHYSAENNPANKDMAKIGYGIISVGLEDGHYFVLCGNLIEKEKVEILRDKITRVNRMNQEELKSYFREVRKTKTKNNKEGGGLGFIEMARKSSKPIEFDFKPIDNIYSFFSIRIIV